MVITEELVIKKPKPKSYSIQKWKIKLEAKIKKLNSDASNSKNIKEQKLKNVRIKEAL